MRRSMPAWSVPRDAIIHLPDGDREVMTVVGASTERVSIYLKGEAAVGMNNQLYPQRISLHRLSPVLVTVNPVARAMANLVAADHEDDDDGSPSV